MSRRVPPRGFFNGESPFGRLPTEPSFPTIRVSRRGVIWTCRSEEHTSELQSPCNLVCRLLLEKKKRIGTRLRPTTRTVRGDIAGGGNHQVLACRPDRSGVRCHRTRLWTLDL